MRMVLLGVALVFLPGGDQASHANRGSAATERISPNAVDLLAQALFGSPQPVSQLYLVLNRRNPTAGCVHAGIDYAAPTGTVVRAARNGTVLFVDRSQFGEMSVFDGANTVIYLHMSAVEESLLGKQILTGTPIGRVGSVGTDSPHLHVEVRRSSHQYALWKNTTGYVSQLTLEPVSYLTGLEMSSLQERLPQVAVEPTLANTGTTLQETGSGFCPDTNVQLRIRKPDGTEFSPAAARTDHQGEFSLRYQIPNGYPKGRFDIWAEQQSPDDGQLRKTPVATYDVRNLPPVARFQAWSGYSGMVSNDQALRIVLPENQATVDVEFQQDSLDPDGRVVSWLWSMYGKNICSQPRCRYGLQRGSYELSLKVMDDDGTQAQDSMKIEIQ